MATYADNILNVTADGQQYIVYPAAQTIVFEDLLCLFDQYPVTQQEPSPQAGRGQAVFLNYQQQGLVRRHYRRGGLMARLNTEHYCWRGLRNTRVWCECALLQHLFQQGLPVPRPLAGRVRRAGWVYSADLLMYRIDNALTLAECLTQGRVSMANWAEIGRTIRRFHDHQVFHADLNAHNILLQGEQVYLIDFDRCAIRQQQNRWKNANLARLQRSLVKLHRYGQLHFKQADWSILIDAYHY